ncbi:7799_t:CDS:2 [Paraglomus occultum]|uniref:7799_t:CDS:1 n=1 Tax=Paraglomus occultum TaxID=144539 RepID=A0A9N9FZ84_9GLOM|nr:7799_t:CDS:2 [Paraglomus occultum]
MILNLVLIFGIIQILRKLDLEDPVIITYIRLAYFVSQIIILALYYVISLKIEKSNDLTSLKYVEPAKPFTNEQPKPVKTNYRDYDREKLQEALKTALTGAGIMMAFHLYFNLTQPLALQSIMSVKTAIQSPLAKIHILGQKAEGDLRRPWKNPNPFAFGEANQPQVDKQAIKRAEKAEKAEKNAKNKDD